MDDGTALNGNIGVALDEAGPYIAGATLAAAIYVTVGFAALSVRTDDTATDSNIGVAAYL